MNDEWRFHGRKQLVWGLVLIVFGALVLADRAGLVEFDVDLANAWRYWPIVLAVVGLTQIIPPTTPRYALRGLWHIFFAGWWYVSFEHLWGLGFGDTWPALLVAWGARIALLPMIDKSFSTARE